MTRRLTDAVLAVALAAAITVPVIANGASHRRYSDNRARIDAAAARVAEEAAAMDAAAAHLAALEARLAELERLLLMSAAPTSEPVPYRP